MTDLPLPPATPRRKPKPSVETIGNHKLSPATLMMGFGFDPMLSEGALKPPIFLTSTFAFESAAAGKRHFEGITGKRPGGAEGLVYSRFNGPNQEILEDRLSIWDEAEDALVFSSGMSAIATLFLAHVGAGDVIVHSGPLYAATESMIARIFARFGIRYVDFPAEASRAEIDTALADAKAMAEGWPGRDGLSRKPGEPDQRAGRCRGVPRRGRCGLPDADALARRSRSTTRSSGPCGAKAVAAGSGHGRLQPDQICRRAQRSGRGRGARRQALARSGAGDAQHHRHDLRPEYRVDADAQPRNARTAHDARG